MCVRERVCSFLCFFVVSVVSSLCCSLFLSFSLSLSLSLLFARLRVRWQPASAAGHAPAGTGPEGLSTLVPEADSLSGVESTCLAENVQERLRRSGRHVSPLLEFRSVQLPS